MGVSIHAYSQMRLTEPHEFDPDACYESDHFRAFALAGFEQSLRGVAEHDKSIPLGYGGTLVLGGRCYEPTRGSDHVLVGDWSYGGYNRWREALCHALHGFGPRTIWNDPDHYRELPGFELIHFADNEGCIGPDAAADLLQDFIDNAERLTVLAGYDDWLEGLRLAADDGLIEYR